MRLARGAGVRGLAGMRSAGHVVRPLLGWRHSELEAVCSAAGIEPVRDLSNEDEQFERVRIRKALAAADWLDPAALAASAAHLADADVGLDWAAEIEWRRAVREDAADIVYRLTDAPPEIRRRIVRRAILALATEGERGAAREGARPDSRRPRGAAERPRCAESSAPAAPNGASAHAPQRKLAR